GSGQSQAAMRWTAAPETWCACVPRTAASRAAASATWSASGIRSEPGAMAAFRGRGPSCGASSMARALSWRDARCEPSGRTGVMLHEFTPSRARHAEAAHDGRDRLRPARYLRPSGHARLGGQLRALGRGSADVAPGLLQSALHLLHARLGPDVPGPGPDAVGLGDRAPGADRG